MNRLVENSTPDLLKTINRKQRWHWPMMDDFPESSHHKPDVQPQRRRYPMRLAQRITVAIARVMIASILVGAVLIPGGTMDHVLAQSLLNPRAQFGEFDALYSRALQQGSVGVIVGLRHKEGEDFRASPGERLGKDDPVQNFCCLNSIRRSRTWRFMLMALGLEALQEMPRVTSLRHDVLLAPRLPQAPWLPVRKKSWNHKVTGKGQKVAILDTGVDGTHFNLQGKVGEEACYSTTASNGSTSSLCPNRRDTQVGKGAAAPASQKI